MYKVVHASTGIVAARFTERAQAVFWADQNNNVPAPRNVEQVKADTMLDPVPAVLYRVERCKK